MAISFTIIVVVVLISVTLVLARVFSRISMNDSVKLLTLLTEQVLVNAEQTMTVTEKQMFNLYNYLNIPEEMQKYKNSTQPQIQSVIGLKNLLTQMVSAAYPYNFVMVETYDGQYVSVGADSASYDYVRQQAGELIKEFDEHSVVWKRMPDGNVYIIREVYMVSPLSYVGKIIVRVSDEQLFIMGDESEELNCTIMLFNRASRHVVTLGALGEDIQASISELVEEGITEGQKDFGGKEYFVSFDKSEKWSVVGILPLDRFYRVQNDIMLTTVLISVIGLVFGIGMVSFLSMRMTRQLNALTESIDAVATGDISQTVHVYNNDDIGQIAIRFNNMTNQIGELIESLVNEEKEKATVELNLLEYKYRGLQSQINPHFIYNTLETINSLAKLEGNDKISSVIQLMSKYFRNNAKNRLLQFMSVKKEFECLQGYAQIYKYIHGDKLAINFEYQDECEKALIPTMILQPILENALEYGMNSVFEKSTIYVRAEVEDENYLKISVIDDGNGMSSEAKEKLFSEDQDKRNSNGGIGLNNVSERIKLLYNDKGRLIVESDSQGTSVIIIIPLSQADINGLR